MSVPSTIATETQQIAAAADTEYQITHSGHLYVRATAALTVQFKAIGDTTSCSLGALEAGGGYISLGNLPIGTVTLSGGAGYILSYDWVR